MPRAYPGNNFRKIAIRKDTEMRRINALMIVAVLGLTLSVAQAEDKKPDATIKLSGGSVAAGLGVSWGSGTLTYQGKEYPISVTGISVGDVGITKLDASGSVYNLKSLDDFDGNYTGLGAGAAVAGGGSAVTMRNQNGVNVNLVATTQGVKIVLGGGGVDMRIKK
jgi:hypothetical protein